MDKGDDELQISENWEIKLTVASSEDQHECKCSLGSLNKSRYPRPTLNRELTIHLS